MILEPGTSVLPDSEATSLSVQSGLLVREAMQHLLFHPRYGRAIRVVALIASVPLGAYVATNMPPLVAPWPVVLGMGGVSFLMSTAFSAFVFWFDRHSKRAPEEAPAILRPFVQWAHNSARTQADFDKWLKSKSRFLGVARTPVESFRQVLGFVAAFVLCLVSGMFISRFWQPVDFVFPGMMLGFGSGVLLAVFLVPARSAS